MLDLQKATTDKISNESFENPKKKSRALKDVSTILAFLMQNPTRNNNILMH